MLLTSTVVLLTVSCSFKSYSPLLLRTIEEGWGVRSRQIVSLIWPLGVALFPYNRPFSPHHPKISRWTRHDYMETLKVICSFNESFHLHTHRNWKAYTKYLRCSDSINVHFCQRLEEVCFWHHPLGLFPWHFLIAAHHYNALGHHLHCTRGFGKRSARENEGKD